MFLEILKLPKPQLLLLSPYNIFRKRRSTLKSITRLISTESPHIKEYAQSSKKEQHSLTAMLEEQYHH